MNYEPGIRSSGRMELGKTICFLGVAKDGPVNESILVHDAGDALEKFGSPLESPLTKAYMVYQESGGEDALLMRITGECARVEMYGPEDIVMELYARNAGVNGNSFMISLLEDKLVIDYQEKGQAVTREFAYLEYDTVNYLAKTINQEMGKIIEAVAITPTFVTSQLKENNVTYMNFYSGDDGTNVTKNDLYNALETSLLLLEGKGIDIVVPVGMYVDDVQPLYYIDNPEYGDMYYVEDRDYLDIDSPRGGKEGYHKLLISFARKQLSMGIYTHVIMGMNPIPDTIPEGYSPIAKIAQASPIGREDGFRVWSYNNWYDIGHYMSVCYGDYLYFKGSGMDMVDNWYISYAALWISSGYGESTTGISIKGGEPVQDFEEILGDLTKLGLVTYRYSVLKGWCVSAGITQGISTNPLYYAANTKIIQRAFVKLQDDINIYLDNESNPIITQSSLSKVVEKSLNERRNIDKIITDYDYTITFESGTDVIVIEMILYTPFTIEEIRATSRTTVKVG